jgi:hypothetical protein
MEKYIPFKMQSLISESLNQVLDKKQLKKLSDFEVKKYKEMHAELLLDDGIPKFEKNNGN